MAMVDIAAPEQVRAHGGSGDEAEITAATLRHHRAAAVLAAAEQAYRNMPGDALADATLRASQEVLDARIALGAALMRRNWDPPPDIARQLDVDKLVAGAWAGVAG
jgi:hypothetical protein